MTTSLAAYPRNKRQFWCSSVRSTGGQQQFGVFWYDTSEFPSDRDPVDTFLDGLQFPSSEPDTIAELSRPIELEEVNTAIVSMHSAKTPGPAGFTSEFYEKSRDKVSPILLKMFQESLAFPHSHASEERQNPRRMQIQSAHLSSQRRCRNCHLENTLPLFISEVQTAFIKECYSFSNFGRLLSVIHSSHSTPVPEVVISLDTEKAFDQTEWEYLFAVLEKFGLGNKFTSWVRLFYSSPQACVNTNTLRCPYFPLNRGTHRGCPLSPLLFLIAIEALTFQHFLQYNVFFWWSPSNEWGGCLSRSD